MLRSVNNIVIAPAKTGSESSKRIAVVRIAQINNDNILINDFRLLEVDNRCIIPFNFPIRIISTSLDVIHA
ncbi:hypothetical protein EUZ93_00025 [Wolbachia pipientis]|nr:hypothetical protein [Wolbachia pipientis]